MVACPQISTLPTVCVGGQLTDAVCVGDGVWPSIQVKTQLVNANGKPLTENVIDPSTFSLVSGKANTETFAASTQGCWSTCDLLPNFNSVDGSLALSPNTTQYEITILTSEDDGVTWCHFSTTTVAIDGAFDYSTLGVNCLLDRADGASCINITCLADATTVPVTATNQFCRAVTGCLPDLTGNVTGNWTDGWVIGTGAATDTFVTFATPAADGSVATTLATGGAGPVLQTVNTTNQNLAIAPNAVSGDLDITLTDTAGAVVTGSITCAQFATFATCLTSGETYTLSHNGAGQITLTDSQNVVQNLPLCNLITGLTANANTPVPATHQVIATDGTVCGLYDLPASVGGDTFVVFAPPNANGIIATTNADTTAGPNISGSLTTTYLPGDIASIDLLLPDASTLTAGTPVPANTIITVETSLQDNSIIRQRTWETIIACGETVTSGGTNFTGTAEGPAGAPIFGCEIITLPSNQMPSTDFPAADFPTGWQQQFTGPTGYELWVVGQTPAVPGPVVNQWRQLV